MPLKLCDPRPGKTPNFTIRGTYLRVRVNQTSGSPNRETANKALRQIKDEIERGAFSARSGPTFAGAALNYLNAGGEDRFIQPLKDHFGLTLLSEIDQVAIDEAASKLYPLADNATRNRQVYTPMSAILKRAGIEFAVKRPKGAQGKVRNDWLWPEQAHAVFVEAARTDPEFSIFLIALCYTGLRLEEGLSLEIDKVRLAEGFAYMPDTKNGDPRPVFLPTVVVAALANHPRGMERPGEFIFRFNKNGGLYTKLKGVFRKAGVPLAARTGFHVFRHTYGTWMTRYASLDARQLRDTGAWRDIKSAARYAHSTVSEEARKAELLPTPKRSA